MCALFLINKKCILTVETLCIFYCLRAKNFRNIRIHFDDHLIAYNIQINYLPDFIKLTLIKKKTSVFLFSDWIFNLYTNLVHVFLFSD